MGSRAPSTHVLELAKLTSNSEKTSRPSSTATAWFTFTTSSNTQHRRRRTEVIGPPSNAVRPAPHKDEHAAARVLEVFGQPTGAALTQLLDLQANFAQSSAQDDPDEHNVIDVRFHE